MNEGHLKFLASPEWAQMLETDLLPWALGVADLGDDVFVPVDPDTLGGRLEAVGFTGVDLAVLDYKVRFSARKP